MKQDVFKTVRDNLSGYVHTIIEHTFPNGTRHGDWWRTGDIHDSKSKSGVGSLAVNLDVGNFIDHATGDKGDFITLYSMAKGLKPLEAAKEIAGRLGLGTELASRKNPIVTQNLKGNKRIPPKPSTKKLNLKLFKTPADWTLPDSMTKNYVENPYYKSHTVYYYRNPDRTIHHAVLRVDLTIKDKDGKHKKTFAQFHFDEIAKRGKPDLTIPYNLPNIGTDETVIIYEGEKCVHAMFNKMPCGLGGYFFSHTTGSGGASNITNTDWSYLKDRNVLIWPDNDPAGIKASNKLKKHLKDIVKSVRVISLPEGKHPKWDAYDACQVMEHSEIHKIIMAEPEPEETPIPAEETPQTQPPQPPQWDEPPIEAYEHEPQQMAMATEQQMATGTSNIIPFEQPKKGRPKKKLTPEMESLRNLWAGMGLALKANGEPHSNEANLELVIEKTGIGKQIHTDDFLDEIIYKDKTLNKEHYTDILKIIQRDYGMHAAKIDQVRRVVESHAQNHRKNCVIDWLNTLEWDGTKRCDDFMEKICGADTKETPRAYLRGVSKYFWMSLTKRILVPGCKVDSMIILEGSQGRMKSAICRTIGQLTHEKGVSNMDQSSKYCRDDMVAKIGTDEWKRQVKGFYIMEVAELAQLHNKSSEEVKQALTNTRDQVRTLFSKDIPVRPRQFILVGTTNQENYLTDPTGARRYLPVVAEEINLIFLKENLDQYFAEAVDWVRREARMLDEVGGYQSKLPEDMHWWAVPHAKEEQAKRFDMDSWEVEIAKFLEGVELDQFNGRYKPSKPLQTGDVWERAIFPSCSSSDTEEGDRESNQKANLSRLGKREEKRIKGVMTRLGWVYKKIKFGKSSVWSWVKK